MKNSGKSLFSGARITPYLRRKYSFEKLARTLQRKPDYRQLRFLRQPVKEVISYFHFKHSFQPPEWPGQSMAAPVLQYNLLLGDIDLPLLTTNIPFFLTINFSVSFNYCANYCIIAYLCKNIL
jgi:hypothetical protein